MREPTPPFYLTSELRSTFKEVVGDLIVEDDDFSNQTDRSELSDISNKSELSSFSKLIKLLQSTEHSVVAVGDTTTLNLVKAGLIPDLSIIDLGTRRGQLAAEDLRAMEQFTAQARVIDMTNPRKEITVELWNAVCAFYSEFHPFREGSQADPQSEHELLESNHNNNHDSTHNNNPDLTHYNNHESTHNNNPDLTHYNNHDTTHNNNPDLTFYNNHDSTHNNNHNKFKISRPGRMGTTPLIIRIEGEEDLASLPCVYFATDGGHVFYGLPDVGLIHIQVNETQRTIVRDALRKMEALYEPHNNQSN